MGESKRIGSVSFLFRFVLGFTWLSLWSTLCLSLMIIALPFRTLRIRIGNFCGKIVGPFITRVMGARLVNPDIKKLNDSPPAIFVTNHTSALDIFICMAICPYGGCGIGKKEIVKIPFFGWAYWLSGHLLIDRGNREKAVKSMDKLTKFVNDKGLSIWIWPEGTRSMDGKLIPFKKGFVHLALATRLPIVPVILHGAHERWPAKTMRVYPGEVRVEVLDSIETNDWNKETIDEHIETVRNVMASALS